MCIEPLYLNEARFKDFKWFVELAKLSGYKKMVIYNNSIEHNPLYDKLFRENEEFIDIHQLNFLPDLIDYDKNVYVNRYSEMVKGPHWSFTYIHFLSFDSIAFHDCLYRYSDKYKSMLIADNDELVVPNKLKPFSFMNSLIENFKLNGPSSLCNSKVDSSQILDEYLDSLFPKYKLKADRTLFFPPVFFMKPNSMKALMKLLNGYLKNANEKKISYPYVINFPDPVQPQFTYNFTINKGKDHDYVQDILNFYNEIIEPFLIKNEDTLKKIVNHFNEFFYYKQSIIDQASPGKSFVNPDTAMKTGPHHPSKNFLLLNAETDYLSHFRETNHLKSMTTSITSIRLDLNYFICYFMPIFQKLTK
jgi:hypothetical protein